MFKANLKLDKNLRGANISGTTGSAFMIICDSRKMQLYLIICLCGRHFCWTKLPTVSDSFSNFSALHCNSFLSKVFKKDRQTSGSMESIYNLIFLLMQRVTWYLEYKISTRCSAEFQTLNLLGYLPQINCYT